PRNGGEGVCGRGSATLGFQWPSGSEVFPLAAQLQEMRGELRFVGVVRPNAGRRMPFVRRHEPVRRVLPNASMPPRAARTGIATRDVDLPPWIVLILSAPGLPGPDR